jgi:hypothetical protein
VLYMAGKRLRQIPSSLKEKKVLDLLMMAKAEEHKNVFCCHDMLQKCSHMHCVSKGKER